MALEKATEVLITKTPGVCGGDACIRGTRIPVWLLVEQREFGRDNADILAGYPHLTMAELEAAWLYDRQHPEEIAKARRLNDEA